MRRRLEGEQTVRYETESGERARTSFGLAT